MPTVTEIRKYFDKFKFKFGRNAAVGSANQEVIWSGGNGFDGFKNTPVKVNIASDDAADVDAGAGAWCIEISGIGIDEDGNTFRRITEVVRMNGTTDVLSTLEYNFIRRMRVLDPTGAQATGDGDPETGPNTGVIQAVEDGGTDVMAEIAASEGGTLIAADQLPINEYGKLLSVNIYVPNDSTFFTSNSFTAKVLYQVYGSNSWINGGTIDFSSGNPIEKGFSLPQLLLPLTKIMVVGQTSGGTVPCSADFEWEAIEIEL